MGQSKEIRWETSGGAADSGESSQPTARQTSVGYYGQDSELRHEKPKRGRTRRGPSAERVKSLERQKSHESNVPLNALNKHQGVTDLQSAQGLEAGPRIGANGKKASGHENDPRLIAGEKL